MTKYEPFAELYDKKPVLVIREQLRHCASVINLVTEARAKGFEVQYFHGGFINDAIIKSSHDEEHGQNHTIRSAKRAIESYTDLC